VELQVLIFDLIFSQGRIGDKTAQTIKGAALTAQALERQYGIKGISVGKFFPPANDDWRISLPQAEETLAGLRQAITASIEGGNPTIMASNTCSASLATLPVVAHYRPDIVVLWCDAHGDFNTPDTSETGYLGGMVLAAACGLWDSGHGAGLRPDQVILIGAHDIDSAERKLLREAGVRIIPPAEVTPEAVSGAINGASVWVHVDWDVLEPGFIPADYQVSGGLLLKQLQAVFKVIPANQVMGIELAEFKAPANERSTEAALSNILDTVADLLM
jgi:arginase family enzyme